MSCVCVEMWTYVNWEFYAGETTSSCTSEQDERSLWWQPMLILMKMNLKMRVVFSREVTVLVQFSVPSFLILEQGDLLYQIIWEQISANYSQGIKKKKLGRKSVWFVKLAVIKAHALRLLQRDLYWAFKAELTLLGTCASPSQSFAFIYVFFLTLELRVKVGLFCFSAIRRH